MTPKQARRYEEMKQLWRLRTCNRCNKNYRTTSKFSRICATCDQQQTQETLNRYKTKGE